VRNQIGKMHGKGIFWKEIQSITNIKIKLAFIKEIEINEVINQCGSAKSLDPNGFNFHFIKTNWETIK